MTADPAAAAHLPDDAARLLPGSDTWVVRLRPGLSPATLRAIPGVRAVEADLVRHRLGGPDPQRTRQAYLDAIGWTPPRAPRRPLVALLDTGVDGGHPDLTGVLTGGARSFVDDMPLRDRSGHGTHLAGIIGAVTRNGVGIAGVGAPRILVVKIADAQGRATTSTIVRGLRYAIDRGARIVNLSFGGAGFSRAEQNAILDARRRGVLVVTAAGATGRQGNRVEYPGAYRHVLSVAAVRPDGRPVIDSTQGPQVALAAPGKRLRSTLPGGRYGERTGTSMAAAVVSGVAARVLAERPGLEVSQLREVLLRSATDVGAPGVDDGTGWGVVNLRRARTTAAPRRDGAEPDDDPALARLLPPLLPASGGPPVTVQARLERWADRSDGYRVTLAAGETLRAEAASPDGMDVDLLLWRPGAPAFTPGPAYTRSWLAASSLRPGPSESLAVVAPTAGEYTVEVTTSTGRGRYVLSVSRAAAPV